jgi:hypothetical protein
MSEDKLSVPMKACKASLRELALLEISSSRLMKEIVGQYISKAKNNLVVARELLKKDEKVIKNLYFDEYKITT